MRIRKMLEWGELDELYGDKSKDRQYCREVIRLISEGQQVNPEPWEDHVTMIDEFHDFMTAVAFRLQNEQVKAEIKRNFAWHYYYQSQLQQGMPWWELPPSQGMPPSRMQQQMEQQQMAAPPAIAPEEVFGPTPEMGMMQQGPPQEMGEGATPGDIQAILQQFAGADNTIS